MASNSTEPSTVLEAAMRQEFCSHSQDLSSHIASERGRGLRDGRFLLEELEELMRQTFFPQVQPRSSGQYLYRPPEPAAPVVNPTPKPTPTTTDSLLCEYCVRIPFDPESLNPLTGTPAGTFLLGSGSRLEGSACPFCLLVRHAYYQSYRQIANDLKIRVTWNLHAGPGKRGAFCVASDSYISFAAREEASMAKGTNGPFYVKPATGPGIYIAQVRQWVSRCENSHSDMCSNPNIKGFAVSFPNLEVLRLIDVEETCVVEMRALPKYVVLSYVWGSVSSLRLTKANRNKLLAPRSLDVAWDMLPRTIQDAITLTQRLGTRYLWVDALCLLQNDSADLDRGVNVMDLIYEQARLTIIAGYGHNADAGLPAFDKGPGRHTRISSRSSRVSLSV